MLGIYLMAHFEPLFPLVNEPYYPCQVRSYRVRQAQLAHVFGASMRQKYANFWAHPD
jgi:hypothetical protein